MALIPDQIISVFLLLFCLSTQVHSVRLLRPPGPPNERPIIGILSQELSHRMAAVYDEKFDSYIAASYVKYLEGSGARVVPIWIGQPYSYYRNILRKLNGVVFPGGSADFRDAGGYGAAGKIIYEIVKQMNDIGDYFPIWGTCLGFELLTYLEANGVEHRTRCSSSNQILPLTFKPGFKESRMFKNAPRHIINILQRENVTSNFHHFCVTEAALANVHLMNSLQIISVNQDRNGLTFVSSLEHVSYPFYAIQFHPEKNNYEWIPRLTIPHSKNSVSVSQYFANFFIDEARKSQHRFQSQQDEQENLIYNYSPVFTGNQDGSSFEQCYLFKKQQTI